MEWNRKHAVKQLLVKCMMIKITSMRESYHTQKKVIMNHI